jgi:hypothetical protein
MTLVKADFATKFWTNQEKEKAAICAKFGMRPSEVKFWLVVLQWYLNGAKISLLSHTIQCCWPKWSQLAVFVCVCVCVCKCVCVCVYVFMVKLNHVIGAVN